MLSLLYSCILSFFHSILHTQSKLHPAIYFHIPLLPFCNEHSLQHMDHTEGTHYTGSTSTNTDKIGKEADQLKPSQKSKTQFWGFSLEKKENMRQHSLLRGVSSAVSIGLLIPMLHIAIPNNCKPKLQLGNHFTCSHYEFKSVTEPYTLSRSGWTRAT